MATKQKYVYFFGAGKAEGKGTDRQTLGGKGAGLPKLHLRRQQLKFSEGECSILRGRQ